MSGYSSHKSTSIKVTTVTYLSYTLRPPLLWGWMDWGIVGDSTMGRLWVIDKFIVFTWSVATLRLMVHGVRRQCGPGCIQ